MLVIRSAQFATLRQAREALFLDKAVAYLSDMLPQTCKEWGPEEIRDSARLALEKSQKYGFVSECDILRYLNLMYALGFEFDVAPEFPWARKLLNDKRIAPSVRMDLLTEHAKRELRSR